MALAAASMGDAGTQSSEADPLALGEPAFLGQDSSLAFASTDVTLAVGTRHFVIARNSAITLYEKGEGGRRRLSEVSLSTFLAPASHPNDRLTDPIAFYDQDAARFFIGNSALNSCPSADNCDAGMQIAVSKTAFPATLTTADWHFYRLDRAELRVNGTTRRIQSHGDYDKFAVSGDKLLIGWQELVRGPAGDQVSSIIRVLDKRPLLNGDTPQSWNDLVYDGNTKVRLATVHDARDRAIDRAFFDLATRCVTNGQLWTIGAVVDIATTPRLETRTVTVATPCHSVSSVPAPQRDSMAPIFVHHVGAQPAYRDGRLWVFEAIGRSAADGTTEIVWVEFDVREWPAIRVLQSGRVTGGGAFAYTPAAALDAAGNLAMLYTQSGTREFLSIYYTGRLATDPPNTMRPPRPLKSGTRSFAWAGFGTPNMPFVDYATVTTDPVDGSLWMAGLLPTAQPPIPGRSEISDAWIARLQPMTSTTARRRPR